MRGISAHRKHLKYALIVIVHTGINQERLGIFRENMKKKESSNQYIYLTILVTMIIFGAGSLLHDPILHSIIGYLNGWQFDSYSVSLGIGNTDVLVSPTQLANTSTFNYWLFYMFPPMTIFILSFILVFFNPNRLIIVAGIIFMSLNFSSLLPNLVGSDSYKATQVLISRGWSEQSAYAVHYIILIVMLLIWALYFYIGTENNPKDAKARAINIWK